MKKENSHSYKNIFLNFGKTYSQKIFSLLLIICLIWMAVSCDSCNNSHYFVPEQNVNTPSSVVITGPQTVSPGIYTYTLTVTYPERISKDAAFIVRCDIYEDDYFGDVVLSRGVRLSFPANATTASVDFDIEFVDDGSGNITIKGTDGSDELEDIWHIYAYVREQTTSEEESGDNLSITYSNP